MDFWDSFNILYLSSKERIFSEKQINKETEEKMKNKIKPLIIMMLTLLIIIPIISIKASSANVEKKYLNQNSLYGTNISNIQFQYKAEKFSSSQCSPVKGKKAPSKIQKKLRLEKDIKPQIISKKNISNKQFQNKLNKDIKFKKTYEYAKELGYTKLNKSEEVLYDNGISAIITPVTSDNESIFLLKYSFGNLTNLINCSEESLLMRFRGINGTATLTMFNREGGVIIDLLNGSIISEWGHHSCSWWKCNGYCWKKAIETYSIVSTLCGMVCIDLCIPALFDPVLGDEVICFPCLACMAGVAAWCAGGCTANSCSYYPCSADCDDSDGYYGSSWEYYCNGSYRYKHRLYYDYYCPTEEPGEGSCSYNTSYYVDDTPVEPCPYGCNELTGNCKGAVTCYDDPDCGDDGWVGSTSCNGNDVYQDWRTYTCHNKGTENSYCDYSDSSTLKQVCSSGECVSGQCQASSSCEDPDYPWWCNEGCWTCVLGNEDRSICCPDSGDPSLCCMNVGPYCDSSSGECTVCGGDYPWECNNGCWGCPSGGDLCCPTSGDPEWCCYTEIGSVCLTNGSCCLPHNETCNNLDDDCDGTIDSFSEGCGIGACANGTRTCTAGSWGSCSTDGLATSETCNNVDDDCDGSVDESLSQECGTDVGVCVKGTQTCSTGNWSACGGTYVGPTDEVCNGIDDNCNNITDEQNVCNNSIVINLEFPENNTVEYINSTPTFGFNITNVNYTSFNCSLWLDNGTPITYSNDSIWINVGNSWNLTANRTIPDNVHYWWINCTDGVNLNISEKRIITINVIDDPPIVSLISPLENNISTTGNITFNCSATDDFDLDNITLYHNISGNWLVNETKTLTGTVDYETFTINNTPDNTNFIWNCLAYDNASQSDWANTNYTVSINITESNITIISLQSIYSDSTYYIFEFIILNNGDTILNNISWQFDTGDNEIINNTYNSTLESGKDIFVFIEYNFSSIGSYNVIVNATSDNLTASKSIGVTITNQTNIDVYDFSVLNQNSTLTIFGFNINNTGGSIMSGINWSLDTGQGTITANNLISLQPNESVFVFTIYNYSSTGDYTVTASATNKTYSDSETITIDVPDIEVSNLTVLNESGNKRIFEFIIENELSTNLTNVSWIFDTRNYNIINSTSTVILQPNEEMFVYIDYNFTTTGTFNVNATAINGTLTDSRNLTIDVT